MTGRARKAKGILAISLSVFFTFLFVAVAATGSTTIGTSISTDGTLTVGGNTNLAAGTFFVDSSNNRVGIGTTSPYAKLSVVGEIVSSYFTATSTTATSTAANGWNITAGCFAVNGTCLDPASSGIVGSGTAGQLPYYASSGTTLTATSSLFLAPSGKIGIGTTSPTFNLDVSASKEAQMRVISASSTSYARIWYTLGDGASAGQKWNVGVRGDHDFDNLFAFETNLTPWSYVQRMVITKGGNVGIGTSSPYAKLSVWADNPSGGTASSSVFNIVDSASSTLFTVLENGRVGIGTDAPVESLHLKDQNDAVLRVETTGTSYNMAAIRLSANAKDWFIENRGTVDAPNNRLSVFSSNTEVFSIAENGSVGIGTTSPAYLLDVDGDFRVGEAGSSNALFVDATNGRVGIGTSSPAVELGIFNNSHNPVIRISGYIQSQLQLYTTASGARNWTITNEGNANRLRFLSQDQDGSNTNYRMVIMGDTGNVGIGTSSPYAKLSVWADNQSDGTASSSVFNIVDSASTTLFTVLENGRVGIGTVEPNKKFHVSGGDILLDNNQSLTWKDAGGVIRGQMRLDDNDVMHYTGAGTSIVEMRIASSSSGGDLTLGAFAGDDYLTVDYSTGNVGIGTASPSQKLHVYSASGVLEPLIESESNYSHLMIKANGGYTGRIWFGARGDVDSNWIQSSHTDGTSKQLRITGYNDGSLPSLIIKADDTIITGNVGIGTTSPYAKLSVWADNPSDGTASSSVFNIVDSASSTLFTVLENGNVGIGTANPDQKFMIESGVNSFLTALIKNISSGGSAVARYGANIDGTWATMEVMGNNYVGDGARQKNTAGFFGNSVGGVSIAAGYSTGSVRFYSGGDAAANERMRITAAGNVGIGTTSPAYLLDVDGDFRVGEAGSSNALFVDATNGRVGIGTAAPGAKLSIKEDAELGTADTIVDALVIDATAAKGQNSGVSISFEQNGVERSKIVNEYTGNKASGQGLSFWTRKDGGNLTKQLTIDESGNVGIGTTSPAYLLDVDGDFRVGEAGSSNALFVDATNGRVGIGTASPTSQLTAIGQIEAKYASAASNPFVVAQADVSNLILWSWGSNTGATRYGLSTNNMSLIESQSASSLVIGADNFIPIIFGTNNSEKVRITGGGNVGIGTTSPAYLLDVDGDFRVGEAGNSNALFVDATNGRVGIGNFPSASSKALVLIENALGFDDGEPVLVLRHADNTADNVPEIRLTRARGTLGAFEAVTANDGLGEIDFVGYDGTNFMNNARMEGFASDDWNITSHPTYIAFRTTPTGSTATSERMRITSAGNVGVGTTSPYAKLSVAGKAVMESFHATSTTATSTVSGNLHVLNNLQVGSASVHIFGNATSTFPYLAVANNASFGTIVAGTWKGAPVTDGYFAKTGNWTGTFDGQEGSYYLNASNLTNFGTPFYAHFSATTTDALTQGSTNKYYSTSLFSSDLAGTTTDALSEGSSRFYWTQSRFDSAFSGKSTSDLSEGANLYFTNARADARINATSTIGTLTSLPNLATVGTIGSGVWNGTPIADGYFAKTGNWTGTFDGQEGSYYLNASNLNDFGTPFYGFFSATTTDALTQGSTNKYYSTSLFSSDLAGTTTDALAEGSSRFYWTQSRFDSAFSGKSTDALTQGSTNLYNQTHTGDVTGATTLTIGTNKVLESMIDFNSAPTANYVVYWNGSKLDYTATSTWDTNTTYTAGTNLTLAGNQFSVDDAFLVNNADDATTGKLTAASFAASSASATSTAANGWNITSGCFAVNGVCVGSNSSLWTDSGASTYLTSLTDNVGIGTTSPTAKLDVAANSSVSGLSVNQSGSGYVVEFKDGDDKVFYIEDGGSVTLGDQSQSGSGWAASYNSSVGEIDSLAVYNGKLYAGQGSATAGSGDVLVFDGTTWSVSYDGAQERIWSLAVYNGKLYAGQGEGTGDGDVLVYDGSTWSVSYDGAQEHIRSLAVYNGKLYAGQGVDTAGDGDVLVFDGTTWSVSYDGAQKVILSLAVYNGKLYAGQGIGVGVGDVLVFNGSSWSTSYDGAQDQINALAVYNGKLYAGQGDDVGDGDIFVFDGSSWALSYDGARAYVRSFSAYNGKLYAGESGASGSGNVLSFDGSTWSISYDGVNNSIPSLAVYDGKLYAGQGNSTGGGDVLVMTEARVSSYPLKFTAGSGASQKQGTFWFEDEDLYGTSGGAGANVGVFKLSHSLITTAGAYDLAETYPTNAADVEPGDILSPDEKQPNYVKKASTENGAIIGVVSTRPGFLLSGNEPGNKIPVSLAGRVPVKVNLEGGIISIGDRIALSSVPGVGAKATTTGRTVGVALEPFSGPGEGKISVFVNIAWNGLNVGEMLSQKRGGGLFASILSWFGDIGVKMADGIVSAREFIADKIRTKELCLEDVCVNRDQLKALLDNSGVQYNADVSGNELDFEEVSGEPEESGGETAASTSTTASSTPQSTETSSTTPANPSDSGGGQAAPATDSEATSTPPAPEPEPVYGCADETALNYNAEANRDDGSCEYPVLGCVNPEADNYDSAAAEDDGSCVISGCLDSEADNYNPDANRDDDSCSYPAPAPETASTTPADGDGGQATTTNESL